MCTKTSSLIYIQEEPLVWSVTVWPIATRLPGLLGQKLSDEDEAELTFQPPETLITFACSKSRLKQLMCAHVYDMTFST